jgi:hypothetical protein
MPATTRLFKHTINLILIVEFQHLGSRVFVNALTIEHETERRCLHTFALSVRVEDLGHLGRFLDLEKRLFPSLWATTSRDEDELHPLFVQSIHLVR